MGTANEPSDLLTPVPSSPLTRSNGVDEVAR